MILTDLNSVTAYRMHTPKWAVAPVSGAGAALYGGRLNRPGVEALYLAFDEQTAINEFKSTSIYYRRVCLCHTKLALPISSISEKDIKLTNGPHYGNLFIVIGVA